MIRLYPKTRPQELSLLNKEVQVIPDQSLSLHTIIRKYTKGEKINVATVDAFYNDEGDEDLEKIRHSDLLDVRDRYLDSKQKFEKLKAENQAKAEAEAKKLFDEKIESIVNERLSQKAQKSPTVVT